MQNEAQCHLCGVITPDYWEGHSKRGLSAILCVECLGGMFEEVNESVSREDLMNLKLRYALLKARSRDFVKLM